MKFPTVIRGGITSLGDGRSLAESCKGRDSFKKQLDSFNDKAKRANEKVEDEALI